MCIRDRSEADDRAFEARADNDPFAGGDATPTAIRDLLESLRPGGAGAGQWLFRVNYLDGGKGL